MISGVCVAARRVDSMSSERPNFKGNALRHFTAEGADKLDAPVAEHQFDRAATHQATAHQDQRDENVRRRLLLPRTTGLLIAYL